MGSRIGPGSNTASRGSSDTVIVRNLPMDCTWQDLRELFSMCGEIKFAEMKDRHIGIVRFGSERDAERAVGEFLEVTLKALKMHLKSTFFKFQL